MKQQTSRLRDWFARVLQQRTFSTTTKPGVRGPTILLVSGRYFSFVHPQALTPYEIAHALSNLCRFTGHSREFYSVAQHAVLVSRLVPPEFAWEGLHHDDGEAVMGDMSSPLKALIRMFKAIETRCERPILAAFGIDVGNMPRAVKHADLRALATEKRDLMATRGEVWTVLHDIKPDTFRIKPLPPAQARQLWMDRYMELKAIRDAAIAAAGRSA